MREFSTVGDGYREMMRLPESERLDYMVKYAQVLEETGDAARDETYQLLERVGELEAQNEALHTALKASGERRERLEAENGRLHGILDHVRYVDRVHAEDLYRLEIHPQSE